MFLATVISVLTVATAIYRLIYSSHLSAVTLNVVVPMEGCEGVFQELDDTLVEDRTARLRQTNPWRHVQTRELSHIPNKVARTLLFLELLA